MPESRPSAASSPPLRRSGLWALTPAAGSADTGARPSRPHPAAQGQASSAQTSAPAHRLVNMETQISENWSQLLWYQSTTATNLGPSKTLVTVVGVRSGPCNPVRRMRAARSCFCLIYAVTLICAEHCASREAGHGRTVAGFAPPCSSTWYKAKMVCTRAAACGRSATTVHMCAPPSGQGSGNLQPEALVSNDAVLSSNDGVVGLAAG